MKEQLSFSFLKPAQPRGKRGDNDAGRRKSNDIQRAILLLNHLCDHGDPDAVEAELLPELVRIVGRLKKRRIRREATATATDEPNGCDG